MLRKARPAPLTMFTELQLGGKRRVSRKKENG